MLYLPIAQGEESGEAAPDAPIYCLTLAPSPSLPTGEDATWTNQGSSSGTPGAMAETHTDTVLIIDFGSQVTQLIARRVREQGVYSEMVPFNRAEDALERLKPRAVILSGGPASVTEFGTPRAPDWVFDSGLPVLGICYGEQTMVAQLGGGVEGGHHREFGRADVEITGTSRAVRRLLGQGRQATRCG